MDMPRTGPSFVDGVQAQLVAFLCQSDESKQNIELGSPQRLSSTSDQLEYLCLLARTNAAIKEQRSHLIRFNTSATVTQSVKSVNVCLGDLTRG